MEGAYYVGRDIVQGKDRLIATIKSRMDALKPSDPHVVYIKGGTSVNYGEVVEVVNAIREAGFDQIGLVVDKKKDSDK
jgi:biopolymer transport protein ExbD